VGAFENVSVSFIIFRMLIVVLGITVIVAGAVSLMHAASLMYHSSVLAGLVAGSMSATSMHGDMEVVINWNLKPVTLGVTENLLVAVTDKVGWVAFPGMITTPPSFEGVEVTHSDGGPVWIVDGKAITRFIIRSIPGGRGVLLE